VASGNVQSAIVMGGSKRPLHLTLHTMSAGSYLAWAAPAQDHLLYVWEGEAVFGKTPLLAGEILVIEHGAHAEIHCHEQAVLLHFERPEKYPRVPGKAGGRAHVVGRDAVHWGNDLTRPGTAHGLFVDSACPTCELWLHASRFPAGYEGTVHSHTEDEIIVVTEGTIILGRSPFKRGATLAVDANTIYSFRAGEDGVTFLNFRPSHPFYVRAHSEEPPMDERAYMLDAIAARPSDAAASFVPD
jgi:hypothetical protein